MDRAAKIQLLKGVQSGKVNVKTAFTTPFAIWLQRGGEYCRIGTRGWINEAEYNKRKAAIKVNIVVPDNERN